MMRPSSPRQGYGEATTTTAATRKAITAPATVAAICKDRTSGGDAGGAPFSAATSAHGAAFDTHVASVTAVLSKAAANEQLEHALVPQAVRAGAAEFVVVATPVSRLTCAAAVLELLALCSERGVPVGLVRTAAELGCACAGIEGSFSGEVCAANTAVVWCCVTTDSGSACAQHVLELKRTLMTAQPTVLRWLRQQGAPSGSQEQEQSDGQEQGRPQARPLWFIDRG